MKLTHAIMVSLSAAFYAVPPVGGGMQDTHGYKNSDVIKPGKMYLGYEGGFAVLGVDPSALTVRFVGRQAQELYRYTIQN